jgi:hypothetical protein
VRSEWIVFGFHCGKLGLDIVYRRSESFQCILEPRRAHTVHSNMSANERQAGRFFAGEEEASNALGLSCLLTRDKVSKLKAPRARGNTSLLRLFYGNGGTKFIE